MFAPHSLARCSRSSFRLIPKHTSQRTMATVHDSIPHEVRTATQPRENRLEPVVLCQIREINDSIRLLRLSARDKEHTIKVRQLTSFRTIHDAH